MPRLVPLDATLAPDFVSALRRVWDAGDAALPVDPRLSRPAVEAVLASMRVGEAVEDGDALVVPTSGSTGEPKGVVLTHGAVAASATAASQRLGVDDSDRWLACLPLAHIGGLSVVTRAMVTGTALTFDVDDPAATLVSLVPTQVERMDVTRFRAVLVGGSADWRRDRPPNVLRTYGLTEAGSGVAYDGVPLDGVEVRVDDDGQVWLRGPMLLRCYRDGADPKDGEGWFPTGDAGRFEDGRVHIEGRMGDVIVTGGEKVWPAPVEAVLRTHPQVADVAVVGRPDDEWGRRVVAVVVPAGEPPSLDSLRGWVKERLPAWCAPREVEVVDALPRTAIGKVRRAEL
ncbi:MAG TPA: AMP-binding protein [Acidimicrobiales bacterium]|nr:AMP-binding protein [Acidimicrobiales bacterium]